MDILVSADQRGGIQPAKRLFFMFFFCPLLWNVGNHDRAHQPMTFSLSFARLEEKKRKRKITSVWENRSHRFGRHTVLMISSSRETGESYRISLVVARCSLLVARCFRCYNEQQTTNNNATDAIDCWLAGFRMMDDGSRNVRRSKLQRLVWKARSLLPVQPNSNSVPLQRSVQRQSRTFPLMMDSIACESQVRAPRFVPVRSITKSKS
jgi:hypothetical protein